MNPFDFGCCIGRRVKQAADTPGLKRPTATMMPPKPPDITPPAVPAQPAKPRPVLMSSHVRKTLPQFLDKKNRPAFNPQTARPLITKHLQTYYPNVDQLSDQDVYHIALNQAIRPPVNGRAPTPNPFTAELLTQHPEYFGTVPTFAPKPAPAPFGAQAADVPLQLPPGVR